MVKAKAIRNQKLKGKGDMENLYRLFETGLSVLSISNNAMSIMNDLIQHLFEQYCDETRQVLKKANKKTVDTDEKFAVRLWLSHELAKHAEKSVKNITRHSYPHIIFRNIKAVYPNDSDDELWSDLAEKIG